MLECYLVHVAGIGILTDYLGLNIFTPGQIKYGNIII